MSPQGYDEAKRRAIEARERSGIDISVYPRRPDQRDFAENDGDAPGKHLAGKEKKGKDQDRMPVMSGMQDPGNYSSTEI